MKAIHTVAALAFATMAAPALAATTPATMTTANCHEHEAVVDGDPAAVAARLPAGFTAVTDASNGAPIVVAHAIDCKAITIGTRTHSAKKIANVGILVQSPDGVGCASGAPLVGGLKGDIPPACNWYTLDWYSGDATIAGWLDGARLRGMTIKRGAFDPAQGGEPYRFRAPGVMRIEDVGRPRPGAISVRGAYWTTTERLGIASDDILAGDATGTLYADSPDLRTLLGAPARPFLPGYDAVATVSWGHLAYTRQPR